MSRGGVEPWFGVAAVGLTAVAALGIASGASALLPPCCFAGVALFACSVCSSADASPGEGLNTPDALPR